MANKSSTILLRLFMPDPVQLLSEFIGRFGVSVSRNIPGWLFRRDKDLTRKAPVTAERDLTNTVLATWMALEILQPVGGFKNLEGLQSPGADKPILIDPISGPTEMPWPENMNVDVSGLEYGTYQIAFGFLRSKAAFEALRKAIPGEDYEIREPDGLMPLASLCLDFSGCSADAASPVVSSFAWGVGAVKRTGVAALKGWSDAENTLSMLIAKTMGSPPYTSESILRTTDALVMALGLDDSLIERTSAVLPYRWFPAYRDRTKPPPPQQQPSPLVMNSFYLADLQRQIENQHELRPALLRRLIAGVPEDWEPADMLDRSVTKDHYGLEDIPLSRWPMKPAFSLSMMQQVAANCILNKKDPLSSPEGEKIVAIDGPPGTGKTTLVRDVVAEHMVQRAAAMAEFSDPEKAFKPSDIWASMGSYSTRLWKIDESITGHEIIVASSNNGACENITKELPSVKAMPAGHEVKFLRDIATYACGDDAWGLIAMPAGNSTNCLNIASKVWFDKNRSLRVVLKALNGGKFADAAIRNADILKTGDVPKSEDAALSMWEDARKDFRSLLKKANQRLRQSKPKATAIQKAIEEKKEKLNRELLRLEKIKAIISEVSKRSTEAWRTVAVLKADEELTKSHPESIKKAIAAAQKSDDDVHAVRPGYNAALDAWQSANRDLIWIERELSRASESGDLEAEAAFRLPHAEFHLASPWLKEEDQELRQRLFQAAIRVHEAFIYATASRITGNLSAGFDALLNRIPQDNSEDVFRIAWQSIFLAIPVLSTTFASVGRMLSNVPDRTIGHLIVDEAGQASPAAVVGALRVASNFYSVGDPMQIEPVVQLPSQIINKIGEEIGLDRGERLRYLAPNASVQTLANRACHFQATVGDGPNKRRTGIPLLVHRRCDEPIFSIANKIAYGGLMVHATSPSDSDLAKALGPSRWVDYTPMVSSKISEDEAIIVQSMISRIISHGLPLDIYVITPFRSAAATLRKTLAPLILGHLGRDKGRRFLYERVGTVHTAQGREAAGVIFVLGASGDNERAARNWAGAKPNLPSVAVTRAQRWLGVVGSREQWRKVSYFDTIAETLPYKRLYKTPQGTFRVAEESGRPYTLDGVSAGL